MKCLLMALFLSVFFSEHQSVIVEFHLLTTKAQEEQFILKYKDLDDVTCQAYVCAVEMKQAEYAINPISKLKIFNRTKRKLDSLIINNSGNIDLRYVRLLLQEKTLSILGYKSNIKEDKEFLRKQSNLQNVSKELQEYIYKNTSL